MPPKLLFIFVEGIYDKLFIEKIIKPSLENQYDNVIIKEYAQELPKSIRKLIKTFENQGYDYILLADLDRSPCVTNKKADISEKYTIHDLYTIYIAVRMIESWHLAGLDSNSSKKLKIKSYRYTNNIVKKQFYNEMKKSGRWDSEIAFREEILNAFSIKTAKNKNRSFHYFHDKFLSNN